MWLLTHSFFFFQAEDGIRDVAVTGVQTCALPISHSEHAYRTTARICSGVAASPNAGMSRERPNAAPPCATMPTQRSSVSAVLALQSFRSAGGTSRRGVVAVGAAAPAPAAGAPRPPRDRP